MGSASYAHGSSAAHYIPVIMFKVIRCTAVFVIIPPEEEACRALLQLQWKLGIISW
jgi:hypothetical protein